MIVVAAAVMVALAVVFVADELMDRYDLLARTVVAVESR